MPLSKYANQTHLSYLGMQLGASFKANVESNLEKMSTNHLVGRNYICQQGGKITLLKSMLLRLQMYYLCVRFPCVANKHVGEAT